METEASGASRTKQWRRWLDPLELFPPALSDDIRAESSRVERIAGASLDTGLHIVEKPSHRVQAGTRPVDGRDGGYRIEISSGLVARLGLLLRCIFDRRTDESNRPAIVAPQYDESAARLLERLGMDLPRGALHERYATLVGLNHDESPDALQWWKENISFRGESFESRNGLRYGYLFVLFHEFAHIARDHIEGRRRARKERGAEEVKSITLGMEIDADYWAVSNLIVYAHHIVDREASALGLSDGNERHRFIRAARGLHLRAALLGIFSIFSCTNPFRWTNRDFEGLTYLHPVTRLALPFKRFDLQQFPSDGEAMFSGFDVYRAGSRSEAPGASFDHAPFRSLLGSPPELRWNWSDFYTASLFDWDMKAAGFLFDMRSQHRLPTEPLPLNVHRYGLYFSEQTFERARCAAEAAAPYMKSQPGLFVSGKELAEDSGRDRL